MNLKVINEIRDETKIFKTVEEFDIYYSKHKDEMNNHTTQYLNRVYKIDTNDGEYRITKKNCKKVDGKITDGEIYLKKVKSKMTRQEARTPRVNVDDDLTSLRFTSIEASVESNKTSINQLNTNVEQLTQLVNDIKDKLNNVIQVINSQINS